MFFSVLGEKVFRGQVSGDYAAAAASAARSASLGFRHDRFQVPHWQNSRDLSSPLQPSSSSRSSSPKARPRSREDWSPAAAQYVNPESLLASRKSEASDQDAGGDGAQARKSQYEPLDLSVRPDSHSAVSPAVLLQMSGLFHNGLSSSVSRGLQGSSQAPAELGERPAYQRDLLVQGTNEEMNSQNAAPIGQACDGDFQEDKSDEEEDNAAKWKTLKQDLLELKESGQASADLEADRKLKRGRAASSLESLTHVDPLQHQGVLLSFLRSQGSLSGAPASAHQAGLNGNTEKDVASGEKNLQITQKCSLPLFANRVSTFLGIYCHLVGTLRRLVMGRQMPRSSTAYERSWQTAFLLVTCDIVMPQTSKEGFWQRGSPHQRAAGV